MRILVAGGAGFIGSWLCETLLDQGHEVTCVDNLFTGSKKNVHHLLSNPRFTFLQWDITVPFKFEADQVYNLACPASPIDYRYDGIETTKISVLGTINLAENALRCGARYLFSSTSEVYGDPTINPQVEDYWGNVNPIGPRSCYDEGKRCAESLLFDYERQHKLNIRVARIFNTYGPRTSPEDGRVVSNFVVQCLSGKPITIHGDGSQTRSFCYVEDTVRALIALMNLDHNPGPVNIGTPKEMPILELAQLIKTLTGSQSELSYGPRPIDDPELRRPNIDKAKRLLNWEPNYSLETGLLNTIAYFRGEL